MFIKSYPELSEVTFFSQNGLEVLQIEPFLWDLTLQIPSPDTNQKWRRCFRASKII